MGCTYTVITDSIIVCDYNLGMVVDWTEISIRENGN